ncbi:DedA family protein [Mollicutes bacterium LVI A0039]|nr:DedA family protein [Mollicutes bacterium LVI A0039]
MDYNALLEVLEKYGLLVVFALQFAEYLNLPGFPATPILLGIGAWARFEHLLIPTLIVSVIGAQAGTMVLYGIGRGFGHLIMERYYKRYPKHQAKIEKYVDRIDNEGPHILTIVRLIPVFRTLITIPAGMVEIDIKHFFWYSLLGIVIWNSFFILIGSAVYNVYAQQILSL